MLTDSTIAPPKKTSHFLQRTFHGCSTRGRILLKQKYPSIFLCAKVYRSTRSGRVSRDTVLQEIRHRGELVLKPAISLKKSWGGYHINGSYAYAVLPTTRFVPLFYTVYTFRAKTNRAATYPFCALSFELGCFSFSLRRGREFPLA